MSLYNMLFGVNPNRDIVLALLGLKECDIERFRDCGIDFERGEIWVYTRTGGANRGDYPNEALTTNPYYLRDEDDEGDCTYATFFFRFPDEIAGDIAKLADPAEHGISARLIRWVRKTLDREPTEGDKRERARRFQLNVVGELQRYLEVAVFNGHTVVPLSDDAMGCLCWAAEQFGGEFVAYWYLLPLTVKVSTNVTDTLGMLHRVRVDTDWTIDEAIWERWEGMFGQKYPKTVARIRDAVEKMRSRQRMGCR